MDPIVFQLIHMFGIGVQQITFHPSTLRIATIFCSVSMSLGV